jgi:anti-anti-sigma factor
MEAKSERKDGVVIFFVNGRLDAFGAQQLDRWVRDALQDDDKELVIDLSGSSYLSSGGIRTFNGLKKEMKRRNGRFALSHVTEYPRKVLEMAGFMTVFDIFPTTEEAVRDIVKKRRDNTLFNEVFYKKIIEDGVKLTIEPGRITSPPVLRVFGDLNKVLYSRITEADIRVKKFSEITYSLGLGALGADVRDAMPLLGEMITLHGSMVWLPTDGHNTPDFLTPLSTGGDVLVYTGFNVTLDGPFNEYFTLETEDPRGVSITDIYRTIFSYARERVKSYSGVIAVTMWGVLAGLNSSGIKKSPVAAAAPPGGISIMDKKHVNDWLASDTSFSYKGDTLVSFGIGIDLTRDLSSSFNPENLAALYYANPLNNGAAKQMYLHNHGVVFRNIPYDASLDLNTQIKKIVTDGEFADMRHLLDSTRLRKAKIGVAYIKDIIRESG